MKQRRMLARIMLAVLSLSFCSVFFALNASANSSDDEWAGYWTYQQSVVVDYSNELSGYYSSSSDDNTVMSYTANKNSVNYKYNYTGDGFSYGTDEQKGLLKGEHAYMRAIIGNPAKQYREQGEINISFDMEIYDYLASMLKYVSFTMISKTNVYNAGKITFDGKEIANVSRLSDRLSPLNVTLNPVSGLDKYEGAITGLAPYGIYDGDILSIEVDIYCAQNASLNLFSQETMSEMDYKTIKIYHFYSWKYGDKNMVIGGIAGTAPGETSTPVPAAIVVGILGAAAAIGAAGAAAEGGSGEASNRNGKNSSYKMYIRKDFGNRIAYGKPPVIVYARMAEVKETGEETDRPDLSAQIAITSGGPPIEIEGTSLAGNYMGALVFAEGSSSKTDIGTVVFRFTGEGGSFTNNVRFELVGEPYIDFPDMKSYSSMMIADMIMGDALTYEVFFEICDLLMPPKTVTLGDIDGEVTGNLDKLDETHYKITLVNNSPAAKAVNEQPVFIKAEVKAQNDKEIAESSFGIRLYPEGLSADGAFENDRLSICSYENESAGDLDYKIKPTGIQLRLAVIKTGDDGKRKAVFVDMKNTVTEIMAFEAESEMTAALLNQYKYELDSSCADDGKYYIVPQVSIPELFEPYYVKLPIKSTYDSETYVLDLPCSLIGEKEKPIAARDVEYKNLIDRVKRYVPKDKWAEVLNHIKSNADTMSVREMRLMSKSIIRTAQDRFMNEAASQLAWADALDWMIYGLEWAKWFGDQAFAYLATVYTGPVGEALLSPAKEILVNLIGEVGVQIVYGESFDFNKLQIMNNLSSALDNLVMTAADPSRLNIRQMAGVLAGFLIFNAAKNYVLNVDEKGNRDFYKAITDAFGNLTSNAMKILASELFGKAMKSDALKSVMKTHCGKWIRNNLQKYLPDIDIYYNSVFAEGMVQIEKLGILDKYIQEFSGMGASKVYTKFNEHTLSTTDSGDTIFTLNLWENSNDKDQSIFIDINLNKIANKLYDYMFEMIFGIFPFAKSVVAPVQDPPFFDSVEIRKGN
ncbi:MAG: hypothetical protein VB118_00340 [Oscillospiraceae bacterium]|nr:hypothetical protein [Oscillospiraceae bacterium]